MAPLSKEQLTGLLVNKLTGLQANSPEWKRTVRRVKYTLDHDKCTSTSEEQVNQSIDGLAEKFSIKGHNELSKSLLLHKSEFLKKSRLLGSPNSNQSILKYDMLQLLLSLSSSSNQSYDYIPNQIRDSSTEKTELTWEEVLKDDPLQGDHWQTWPDDNSSNESVSDEDGYEFDEQVTASRPVQQQQQRQRQSIIEPETPINYVDQMDIDNQGDTAALGSLITQQYWRDDFSMEKEDSTQNTALLQNPCQMSDALGNIFYSEAEQRQLRTIPESGIIREVMSLLRGYRGVLFKYEDDHFQLDENYIVQHLSQNALAVLLREFCTYGNVISELRQIVTRVANDMIYGQTSQAFAAAIYKSLMDFDGLLSQSEVGTNFITRDPTQSISILKLRTTLDCSLQCFKAIHEIAIDTPYSEKNPRLISTYLISTFYDRALIAQSAGQLNMYDTLLYVLEQLLEPYGRIIDDWIFYGSLNGDRCNEFYVSRRDDVSTTDSNFWRDGFYMEQVEQEFICFPCPLFDNMIMSRIFFTGKAVNLLSQIEKKKKHVQLMTQEPVPFSVMMKSFLVIKPPFITYTKKEAPRRQQMNTGDIFGSTFFPMTNLHNYRQQHQEQEPDALIEDDLGSLFDQNFKQFIEKYIQEPYRNTADTLTNVLHKNCRLPEQLKSLASIYLMLENDLMHSLCEVLFTQMDNNENWFDKRVLNSTFAEACETSGYDEIIYMELKERNNQEFNNKPVTAASYLELIDFKVQIPWPLNNFIQNTHLENYSKIASFLLRLKRAKYVMEKKTLFRGRTNYEKSNVYAMRFYSIRMKMLWFINAFWRYIMTTILHAETIEFRNKLSVSKDADEITALHASYIRRIVDRCLLNDNSSAIKKSVVSIFDMAEQMAGLFVNYMQLENQAVDLQQFSILMNAIEKDFNRTNEFISISLMILGKKGGLPWFESLATSLTAN